jgi:dTDP-4-amino-4,6-dideoxygalactose transaminase
MEHAYAEALKSPQGNPYVRRTVAPLNVLETSTLELIWDLRRSRDSSALEELRSKIRELTGAKHVIFAPSCRCALAQVLSALPQSEVVMPAFTCPVVKTAVEFAGKRIRYVDISRHNLNATSAEYDLEATRNRILLPTHLFGIPTDIEDICDLARRRGCVTIEDAAAALGARRRGRPLGTFADIGVFSFERSKRFPAFRGAAIIINNDRVIDPAVLALRPIVPKKNILPLKELMFSLFYNAVTKPWIYGRFVLPRLLQRYADYSEEAEQSENPPDSPFYNRDFHAYQAALALRCIERIGRIRAHIEGLVSIYQNAFQGTQVQTFVGGDDDKAALLRFPVVLPGVDRATVLRQALSRGLYLETNYEKPLPPEREWARFPNSLWAAQNLILLPLYTALTRTHSETLATKVANIAHDASHRTSHSEEKQYATQLG